jgi:hypothetical protein
MIMIECSLRFAGLPTTCRLIGVVCDLESTHEPATQLAVLPRRRRRAAHAAVIVVAHWPAGNTCPRRCLLVGHRLRDLRPVLRIGVRRDAAVKFGAHSWLEIDRRTPEPAAAGFAVLGSRRG